MPRPKLFDIEVKTGMTDAMHRRLTELARQDARTVSDLVRDAIRRYLQERFEEGE
jgi:predicted DNA-binding protein